MHVKALVESLGILGLIFSTRYELFAECTVTRWFPKLADREILEHPKGKEVT